ncbi:alpha/beta superfamily hydrolase [Sphingobium wenxiniae]|uniref:Putative redox protein n=1 Tax=Sphingobium wenxiniae (strain DSM 21828 / CGMCC 1.7748 / JZ-1) TaxID=595605 RepID=A0A562K7G7_SPHWJ|nr:alpha/beta fold hydrolase [Sphingobium wenxiniae]MBB6192766.1 alpha/beta superfamily hydrolase [Sphingobium wenxiniae]TWH91357.1 putative redox protein [Sphingobium wenxiniae]
MGQQVFEFDGASENRLSGRLEFPQTTPRGWAIFAHCFTCGKDSLAAVRVSRALALGGIGVLRFDFAGLGSGGEGTFAADVDDLVSAVRAMTEAGMPPSLLIGHSLGGAAALAAAGSLASIEAVATIGAPADLEHILGHFDPTMLARAETEGTAEVELGGRTFVIRRSFINDVREQDLLGYVRNLRRPLLILHAPGDRTRRIDTRSGIVAFRAIQRWRHAIRTCDRTNTPALSHDGSRTAVDPGRRGNEHNRLRAGQAVACTVHSARYADHAYSLHEGRRGPCNRWPWQH